MAFFPYGWVRHLICDNVVHLTVYGEKLWKVYGLCHFPSDYQKVTTKNKRVNLRKKFVLLLNIKNFQ